MDNGAIVLGWRERVELPAWGVRIRRGKIDTGARTSALHVENIEEIGGDRVRFQVVVRERPERRMVPAEAAVVRRTVVKPSSGQAQERLVVSTLMRIGRFEREVEFTLVSRSGMLCPILVGRRAIAGRCVVDPGRTYVETPRRLTRKGGGS